MIRSAQLEYPRLEMVVVEVNRSVVEVMDSRSPLLTSDESVVDAIIQELSVWDGELEVRYSEGKRMIKRYVDRRGPEVPWELYMTQRGSLDNMIVREQTSRIDPGPDEVEVCVHTAGLNFRDVLNVLGMYPGDPGLPGVEFSGVVTRLGTMGNLKKGETVLIHNAAGGVGLVAIQYANRVGARVIATASPGKHEYLKQLGVHLSGDYIPISIDSLGPGGRFMEIGKRDTMISDDSDRYQELLGKVCKDFDLGGLGGLGLLTAKVL
eukprot:gene44338-55141_t